MRLSFITAFALIGTSAMAADMVQPLPPMVSPPVHDWTGFYAGLSGGIGGGTNAVEFQNNGFEATVSEDPFLLTDTPTTWYPFTDCFIDGTGFWGGDWNYCGNMGNAFGGFIGGQIGYNFQQDDIVFGVEADAFLSNISATGSSSWEYGYDDDDFGGTDTTLSVDLDAFGTIRGRVGMAFDRFLPYVTGGIAWGQVTTNIESYNFNNDNDDTFIDPTSASEWLWGWTAGIGAEYAITESVSIKSEYLYMDLGDSVAEFAYEDDAGPYVAMSENVYHTLKVGLNVGF